VAQAINNRPAAFGFKRSHLSEGLAWFLALLDQVPLPLPRSFSKGRVVSRNKFSLHWTEGWQVAARRLERLGKRERRMMSKLVRTTSLTIVIVWDPSLSGKGSPPR